MTLLRIIFASWLLLLSGSAGAALTGWDQVQLELLQQYSTPFRWYNIEGPPFAVAGPPIRHSLGRRLHVIKLNPGESITLRSSAANRWLRIAAEAGALRCQDVQASVSTDGRAYASQPWVKTADSKSLLLTLPAGRACLIRLTRPEGESAPLRFASFLSVEEPFGTLAPYREPIHLPGKSAHLRRDDELTSQPLWSINPEEGTEFAVNGPAQLQLNLWLPWPSTERLNEQALTIQATLDGLELPDLLLSPSLDATHRTILNRSEQLLSQRMQGFLAVPNGRHLLRLKPAVSVLLAVYRQSGNDLVLPRLNAPATNTLDAIASALVAPLDEPGLALKFPNTILSPHAFVSQEQTAWRLARDNSSRDTGAQAADALARLSQSRLDYPRAQQTAEQLWRDRAFYRELLPVRLSAGKGIRRAFFSEHRLKEPFEPEHPVAIYNPTLEQVEGSLAQGAFVPVPSDPALPLIYELPSRSYQSELRVALMSQGPERSRVFVAFDESPPTEIAVQTTNSLALEALEPSAALATLRVLEHKAAPQSNVASGLAIGEFDLSPALTDPAAVELPLPAHARQVRVYQRTPAIPLSVSVAYRAAKPFTPGETGYLSLLSRAGSPTSIQMLAGARTIEAADPESVHEMRNALLPLIRLLKANITDFKKSIDVTGLLVDMTPELKPGEASQLKAAAEDLETRNQSLEAVEAWNRLFWRASTEDRLHAALSIMRLLQSLGEDFLAGQYARYVLLKDTSLQMSTPAIALLEDSARKAEDTELLEQIRAFLFTRCPCEEHLANLVEALALNGRDEMVLWAGMLLPEDKRPHESMLPAALHVNWWQSFDRLTETLPSRDLKSFWRAQKHVAFYDFPNAEAELARAGARGDPMLRALRDGARIRSQLTAPELASRVETLSAWEKWQSESPGSRSWQQADDLAVECAATELVFNVELNQITHFFRSEPGTPVTFRFLGPIRLQFEARPLLESPFVNPVDDWLELVEYGITNRIPIFQAVPNPALQFISATNAFPAVRTFVNLEWGPGFHEVKVRLTEGSGLLRVLQEQPVLPLRVLPMLNTQRIEHVLGSAHPSSAPSSGNSLSAAAQWLAARRWNSSNGIPGLKGVTSSVDILQVLEQRTPPDLSQHLTTLLRISEERPEFREEAQCLAEMLAAEANYPTGTRKIVARLSRDRVWLPLPVTPLSAGVRPLRIPADLAQDPGVRLRRALLPLAGTNQFTISAQNEFAVSMSLQHTADVRFQAELAKAGFSPAAPLTISLQVDNQESEHFTLEPLKPGAERRLSLEPGPHLVRAWIEDPVVNQFARVTFEGTAPGVTNSIWSAFADAAMDDRFFHGATAAQPLRFAWKGPALLRVDEWREGQFLSRIQFVPRGDQTVEIGPAPGREESWYRIFVRSTQTTQPQPRAVWAPREVTEMPGPVLRMPGSENVSEARLTDYYALGGQEDGTWSAGILAAHRRPFEAGGQFNSNEFLELDAGYRKAATSGTLWFNTEALARLHRPGELTLGLAETIVGRPQTLPLEWSWSGQGFAGWLGSERSDFEAALYSEFEVGQRRELNRKLDWHPYLSFFGHYLTLGRGRAAGYSYIDQDLYTDYRYTHRWGARLGSELEYRPWLDTLVKGGLELVGNEDFTPDHWALRLAWNQMLGPARGEVAYRFSHFLSDSDRSSDSFLQSVSAGLFTEFWLDGRHRFELGGQYRHEWPASVDSYFLVLRWHFSNGRGYTDYAPNEMAFRNLRSRNIPAGFNNRLDLRRSDSD